jgi:hypothetical protein
VSDQPRQLVQHLGLVRRLEREFPDASPETRRECYAMAVRAVPAGTRSAAFLARSCIEAKQRAAEH